MFPLISHPVCILIRESPRFKSTKNTIRKAGKLDFQVGFIAINIEGENGAYSIYKGISYTYYHSGKAISVPSACVY